MVLQYQNYIKDYHFSRNIINRSDYKIELIKNYPCNSKKELEEEEAKYIRNNKCINRNIPHRTKHEWYEDNKEEINKHKKEKYEINKKEFLKKITCECGAIVSKPHISKHRKTKKHIKLLEEISM